MESNTIHITKLVTDFQSLNQKLALQRWQNNYTSYVGLLSRWQAIQVIKNHIELHIAPNYNIFYIMKNISSHETKLHSPFLADLFNVHGEHKQGILFYDELVNTICKYTNTDKELYFPKDTRWLSSATEVWCGSGGIDILLSYRNGRDKFAIAIENKIYANDQENQIKRYYEYLEREFEDKFILIYLTIDGRKPSFYSAPQEFVGEKTILCLSYRKDIVDLLNKTLPQIIPPVVHSTIKQYLEVCQKL